MSIININGGLGNQLFQYAFSRYIGEKYDISFKYDLSDFQFKKIHDGFVLDALIDDEFKIADKRELREVSPLLNFRHGRVAIRRFSICNRRVNYESFLDSEDRPYDYYMGNWQNLSINYVGYVDNKLKDEFEYSPPSNSVFVHVRRGDYLLNKIYRICDIEYYEKAIRYIDNVIEGAEFYVLSNDLTWCREAFKKMQSEFKIHYVDCGSSLKDFNFMRSCGNAIISNSTFSWWAAQLIKNQRKIVVSPSEWFTNSKNLIVMPSSWVSICLPSKQGT